MSIQILALFFEAVRRHHIIRRKSTEVTPASKRKTFFESRQQALVRSVDVSKTKFICKTFQNFRRTVRTSIINDNQFKVNTSLGHHRTHCIFYIQFMVIACKKYRNFGHHLSDHFSRKTTTSNASNVKKFSRAYAIIGPLNSYSFINP